ncbi:MAG: acyl-CoA dehydrogenase family protein [Polyangiales bacterium]
MTKNPTLSALSLPDADALDVIVARYLDDWSARERTVCSEGGQRLPAETVRELRASGLLGAPVPRVLGGLGADLLTTSRAVRSVAERAPSTALCLAMPLGNAANARLEEADVPHASRDALAVGRAFIAERATAGVILAVANSEPGSCGDLANTRTLARRDGDVVRLTGKKSFATLGADADFFLCAARHEDGALDAFFVARDAAGVTVAEAWNALGLRATASVGMTLEDAQAAATFLYPGAIDGVNARHWSTLLLGSVFVGIGQGAVRAAAACAPGESSFARATLAECVLTLDAAAGFLDSVAREDCLPAPAQYVERCRRAKTFAARTALEVSTRCMMIAGGRAYRPEHDLARALLDAAAGPSLRPTLPQAMDQLADALFAD